ncbi:hypothetical protein LOZ65_004708 [Ophidiomyces ophidiicola]|nr:hypothetical protein LOZ65_004708 [Ophidiomyces ophidiicola]
MGSSTQSAASTPEIPTTTTVALSYQPKLAKEASIVTVSPRDDDRGTPENEIAETAARGPSEELKFQKKKKRTGKGGKKKKPTGFEDFYVDAPVTPAEYEVEKKLYDLSVSIIHRLETAIQRYETKRRMNSERRDIFVKYLSFGGVKVGPKMFEGNDQKDLQRLDSEQIITATAETNIPEDRANWEVDFEMVVKGFLSSVIPQYIGLETEPQVELATSTVKNFLNYILHHDVCPEYKDNIMSARFICDEAKRQLWNIQQANLTAPGDFNIACSTLFGGSYFGAYTGDREWSEGFDPAGMSEIVARKVVKFALAGAGTHEQAVRFLDLANDDKLTSRIVHTGGFEIIAISPASPDIKDFYHAHANDLKPVGKVQARAWYNPELLSKDYSMGGFQDDMIQENATLADFEFFVEDSFLRFYFVGMKVEAHVRELNCGIKYFDTVLDMHCSFHTILPNQAMVGWKEPRDIRPDHLCWLPQENNADKILSTVESEEEVQSQVGMVGN